MSAARIPLLSGRVGLIFFVCLKRLWTYCDILDTRRDRFPAAFSCLSCRVVQSFSIFSSVSQLLLHT